MRRAVLAVLCVLAALPASAQAAVPPNPFLGVFAQDSDYLHREHAKNNARGQSTSGFGTVRADFDWGLIEPHRGTYDWTLPDRIVRTAGEFGQVVQPTVYGSPEWATGVPSVPGEGVHPPRDVHDYSRLMGALVRRYGPGGEFWRAYPHITRPMPIRAWEIWNEPSLEAFWKTGPDPVAYTSLLRGAAAAIRGNDAGAEVIAGGLPDSLGGIAPEFFLAQMYMAGAKDHFDTIGVHPYGPDHFAMLAVVDRMRRVADDFGDTDAAMRVTEFGWASAGDESIFTVGEERQAYFASASVLALRRAAPRLRLKGVVYFKWFDHPRPAGAPNIWPYHTGLIAGSRIKPALRGLKLAMAAPVDVPAATAGPLAVALRGRTFQRRTDVRRRGYSVSVRCSADCTAAVRLTVGRPVGTRVLRSTVVSHTRTFAAGRLTRVRLRLSSADLAEAFAGRLRVWADVAAIDVAGRADAAPSLRLRLRSR